MTKARLVKEVRQESDHGSVYFPVGALATISVAMVSGAALLEFDGIRNVHVLVEADCFEKLT